MYVNKCVFVNYLTYLKKHMHIEHYYTHRMYHYYSDKINRITFDF